jgi:tetratricopeptide (TPR) repeat protein
MKNDDHTYHIGRIGIMLLISLSLCSITVAKDWPELNILSDSELTEKMTEFQKKLDQVPDDYEILKGLGIAYHIKALKDPKAFAPQAVETLTKVSEKDPTDYVTLCYLGSATTLMAQTTKNVFKMSSYSNKGFALMDKAVRNDPDNASIRLTRAHNSKNVPAFLNRGDIAIEDFEYLAEMIKKDPVSFTYLKKQVYSNLAVLYKKRGEEGKAAEYTKLAEGL